MATRMTSRVPFVFAVLVSYDVVYAGTIARNIVNTDFEELALPNCRALPTQQCDKDNNFLSEQCDLDSEDNIEYCDCVYSDGTKQPGIESFRKGDQTCPDLGAKPIGLLVPAICDSNHEHLELYRKEVHDIISRLGGKTTPIGPTLECSADGLHVKIYCSFIGDNRVTVAEESKIMIQHRLPGLIVNPMSTTDGLPDSMRWNVAGFFATLVVVIILIGSLIWYLKRHEKTNICLPQETNNIPASDETINDFALEEKKINPALEKSKENYEIEE